MFKIDEFNEMYSNPDASYEKLKDKLGVNSKREFLNKLCFTNTGDSLIQVIKIMLKQEQPNYDDEHNVMYTNIIEILNALEIFVDTEKFRSLGEIGSLNSLFLEIVVSKSMSSNSAISPNFVEEMFFHKSDVKTMNGMQLFTKYGEINSFSKMYRNKLLTVKLEEDFTNDFFIINLETAPKISTITPNEFLTKCLETCPILNKSNLDFKGNLVFGKKSLYVGGKLFDKKAEIVKTMKINSNDVLIVLSRGIKIILL